LAVTDWRLRTGGYGLALAALALVVFGPIECPPIWQLFFVAFTIFLSPLQFFGCCNQVEIVA